MKHIFAILCIVGLSIVPIAAQTKTGAAVDSTATAKDTAVIERKINIEKEYVPELTPSTRTPIEYDVQEQHIKKAEIHYSGYASEVQPKPQFYPLEPQKSKALNRKNPRKGYAAVGVGYPINWLGQLYYPILSDKERFLDIHIDHDGYFQGKKQLIDTDFDMWFAHNIGQSDRIYTGIGYSNLFYTYYGDNDPDSAALSSPAQIQGTDSIPARQSIHHVRATIGAQSVKDRNGWLYDANLGYDMAMLQYSGVNQHTVTLDGIVSKEIANNQISVGINLDSYFYGYGLLTTKNNLRNNATLALSPAYQLQWNGLDFRIGARLFFSFNKGMVFNAMPDVSVKYNVGKLMNVYVDITGDYQNHSLASTLEECRYWTPDNEPLYNTYTPVDAAIGVNIKPIKGMMLNISADYRYNLNDHFFVNKYQMDNGAALMTNTFTAIYGHSQCFDFNARLSYNYTDRYTAYTRAVYHLWYADRQWQSPWHRPDFEWEVGAEVRPIRQLVINANMYIGTGYKAGITSDGINYSTVKMSNHYDLNLGASYTFNKTIGLFLRLNNLLSLAPSLRYQDWYGYDNIGFNCLIGLKFGF